MLLIFISPQNNMQCRIPIRIEFPSMFLVIQVYSVRAMIDENLDEPSSYMYVLYGILRRMCTIRPLDCFARR